MNKPVKFIHINESIPEYSSNYEGWFVMDNKNKLFIGTSDGWIEITNSELSDYLTKEESEKLELVIASSLTNLDARVSTIEENISSIDGKQDELISGINIKTINGESILGNGNITISGGNGGAEYTQGTGITISSNTISLSSDTITSLEKANTALQSHQNIKTINGNTITGTGNVSVGTVTSVGIVAGTGIEVTNSPVTTSGNITVNLPTTMVGSTTVNSISNIPVTHRAVLATISATNTLSFNSLPEDGFEVHVIIRNSGSSTITITLPSSGSYVCTSESTIYVAAGKYGEVNVITIGSTGYIHGISSI